MNHREHRGTELEQREKGLRLYSLFLFPFSVFSVSSVVIFFCFSGLITSSRRCYNRHMNQPLTLQRIRITFGKHGALRFIGHLDLAKTWERALRRAQIPLEYTQGFNPRPRLQFAAALQVGVTSESELLDAWLTARLDGDFPAAWIERLNAANPAGLRVYDITDVPIKDPALPTQVSTSEFVITPFDESISADDLRARVETLLAQPTIERVTANAKRYDLRPRILDLTVDEDGSLIALLSSNERSNARPDELVDALGLPMEQVRIHRRRLNLDNSTQAAE